MNLLVRIFLRGMSPSGLIDLISRLLIMGLVFLMDGFFLLVVSSALGGLYAIAITAGVSLLMCFIVGSSFQRHSRLAGKEVNDGVYPTNQFIHLGGLLLALLLGVIPGLFTAAIAAIVYLPFFRKLSGKIFHDKFSVEYREIYNYLRMNDE